MKQLLFAAFLFCSLQSNAQDTVAASKEPLHKIVFENQYIRVLDLHIAPGDTTRFHKHEIPCVSISLHPVRTGSQTIVDHPGPKVSSVDRRITFEGFYGGPRVHRVWNSDTAVFHWMDIEVLTKGDRNVDAPTAGDGFTQVFDAPPVRAYRLVLTGEQKLQFKRNAPVLLVCLNETGNVTANKKLFSKQGDFLFAEASEKISLTNRAKQESTFAVLELR